MKFLDFPLPHFEERTASSIDTIVIHSIYSTQTSNPFDEHACLAALDSHNVSAHYLIRRDGGVMKLVEESKRAWHAGTSKMPFSDDARESVNDFSIGVELIGTDTSGFTEEQYDSLSFLITESATRHPIKNIVGHDDISPGRKTDPGPLFDWNKLRTKISSKNFRYSK